MSSQKLTRTTYNDPTQAANPNQARGSSVRDSEALVDFQQYLQPLEQVHGSSLHGWGVASGLAVTITTQPPGLLIKPGVALDSNGQHVSLAVGGFAETGVTPNVLGGTRLVSVSNDGAALPTSGLNGAMYLTISFLETFDITTLISSGQQVYQVNHTPWLQLFSIGNFGSNDGSRVVLALVNIDGAGNVTSITPGLRQGVSIGLERLNFSNYEMLSPDGKSIGASPPEAGALMPRGGGGLTLEADTLGLQTTSKVERWSFDNINAKLTCNGTLTFSFNTSSISDINNGLQIANPKQILLTTPMVGIGVTVPGHALDVGNRIRLRQGSEGTAGLWLFQTSPNVDRAFVGMASDHQVGLYGNNGAGWGLAMDTATGNVGIGTLTAGLKLDIQGDFGRANGAATMHLWGSTVADTGTGLVLTGGGGLVSIPASNKVGIGTTSPQGSVDIQTTTANQVGLTVTAAWYAHCSHNSTGPKTFAALGGPGAAAIFGGTVEVLGTLTKTSGMFKIDHPLDPANKYLLHSFVESPEMLNIYSGTAVTGADGEVVVELPGYFEALNTDVRYQVTPLGQLALAAVIRGVEQGRFVIKTDKPKVTVNWLVTGVRQDVYAKANPIEVEQDKTGIERGTYLHPRLHKQSISKHVWKAHVRDAYRGGPSGEDE